MYPNISLGDWPYWQWRLGLVAVTRKEAHFQKLVLPRAGVNESCRKALVIMNLGVQISPETLSSLRDFIIE